MSCPRLSLPRLSVLAALAAMLLIGSSPALASERESGDPSAQPASMQLSTVGDAAPPSKLLDITGTEGHPQWLYLRTVLGVSARPIGLLLDTQLEHRWRLWRSADIPFRNTFLGAGARLALSPAYVDVGPQLTFAPIDLFDVQFRASYARYFSGDNGLVGYDSIGNTTAARRELFAQGTRGADMLSLSVAPTLKLKVGPIIAVGAASVTALYTQEDDALPLAFEIYRHMTIARGTERVTEYSGALIAELANGDNRALVWFGALAEHARASESGDQRTAVGPLFVVRPGRSARMPRFLVQGRYYLQDADFQGGGGAKIAIIWDGNLRRPRDRQPQVSESDTMLDALLDADDFGS